MSQPCSCPGCGADWRPECRYCGRQNERPRMYTLPPSLSRGERVALTEALKSGHDGMVLQTHAERRGARSSWDAIFTSHALQLLGGL